MTTGGRRSLAMFGSLFTSAGLAIVIHSSEAVIPGALLLAVGLGMLVNALIDG